MKKFILILAVFILVLSACIGGGTHGYIKAYRYPITKTELEMAVRQIIDNSNSIGTHQKTGE